MIDQCCLRALNPDCHKRLCNFLESAWSIPAFLTSRCPVCRYRELDMVREGFIVHLHQPKYEHPWLLLRSPHECEVAL